jgi:DNA-binding response OmpR family regulator
VPSHDLAGLRILVLEDEFLIAMDVEDVCREHGAAHVLVRSKLDGLDGDPELDPAPDAAILDLMLGNRSSLEYGLGLRERGVPVVFTSGFAGDHRLFERFPEAELVPKPYTADQLVRAVRAAIDKRSGGG